ncbi:uncharacterized protein BX664DRAFT_190449 [Halteromyces radiatus]|uniref:uncharacterized protein n=1 Tax=Halteromyces radiatus TaxID=101107 RepID=UPI002220B3D8|nr:uncharacterized protein BX664DRAFT_190449 [Halteromyces radiatus]KAI8083169.1 hypothetical protein BX664DRAFT_190449 [Halteromyces radiatus]
MTFLSNLIMSVFPHLPTTIGTSKIAAPSTSAASSSSVSSSSSSTSPDNTRRKSTTKSSSLARPKSSLGSRPSTPSSAATTTIKKLPTNGGKTQETTSITKKVMTQPSAVKKSTVLRPPKVQTNKTRKESKTSRITARSDPSKQSSSDPVASMGPSTSKRLVNAGNISKNSNPGISVLTGRTRKFSTRLDSRKNANSILSSSSSATGDTTTAADTTVTVDATSTVDASAQKASELPDTSPIVDTPATVDAPPPPAITDTSVETNDHSTPMPINDDAGDSGDNVPNASESLNTVPSVSTSFSQHTTESDHDAEVAAATSAQSVKNGDSNGCNRDSNGKCNNDMMMMDSIRVESPFLQLDRRRSSSFSPVSVASSLTRPETPEVDNLRQRFEVLAQSAAATSTMTTGSVTRSPVSVKRGSSITPEMASRIKDLKPRDPVGSRVKSMVEFFMDENLHKWEF